MSGEYYMAQSRSRKECMVVVLCGGRSMVVFRLNASAAIDPGGRSSPCLACTNG